MLFLQYYALISANLCLKTPHHGSYCWQGTWLFPDGGLSSHLWPSGSLHTHCLCQLRLPGETSLTIFSTLPSGGMSQTEPDIWQCNQKSEIGTGITKFLNFLTLWLPLGYDILFPWNIRSPSFHLAHFLAETAGRSFPFRDVPFSFCGWGDEAAMKSGASLSNHENIHFPWECCFGFQVDWGFCLHSAQCRNSHPPPCEHTPFLMFLQSVPFLSISLSLRHHSVDIFLSKMPNIQERTSESASC